MITRPIRVTIIERVSTRTATGATVTLKPVATRYATMKQLSAQGRAIYQQLKSEATYEFLFRDTPDPAIELGKHLILHGATNYEPLAPMTAKDGWLTVPAKEL
jgi:hypothetical protein